MSNCSFRYSAKSLSDVGDISLSCVMCMYGCIGCEVFNEGGREGGEGGREGYCAAIPSLQVLGLEGNNLYSRT